MSTETLILHVNDLLSKWGFGDGDLPDELWHWLDTRGIDPSSRHWDAVLRHLVRERVLPVLDQQVEAVDVYGIHNPIRAGTVDGVDVTNCWYGDAAKPTLTPATVEISFLDVLATIESIKPPPEDDEDDDL